MEHKMEKAWKQIVCKMKDQVTCYFSNHPEKNWNMTWLVDSHQKHSWPG